MRISRNSHSALFNEHDLHKGLKSGIVSIQRLSNAHLDTFRSKVPYIIQGFSRYNGLEEATEQERLNAFLKFNQRAFSMFLGGFNVEVASDSFYDSLDNCSVESVLEKGNLYDVLGECGGIILCPGEGIVEYAIMKEGTLLRFVPDSLDRAFFVYDFGGIDKEWLSQNRYERYYYDKAISILILKKYGEVESVMVARNTNRTINGERVVNNTPFPIHRLDSSWFKTIIRTEGFMVRGFWRLQPCGKGHKERRLTFVPPFMKHGYVRRAPAHKARLSA